MEGARNIEVIVVDGGSTDKTVTVAQNLSLVTRVLHSARGRSQQLNFGAANATGSILLFLHADTILPKAFDSIVREVLRFDYHLFSTLSNQGQRDSNIIQNRPQTYGNKLPPKKIVGAFEFKLDHGGWQLHLIERVTNWRARFLKVCLFYKLRVHYLKTFV
jgi:glycosyltransferase involved in cell wall biosynthesis